MNNKKIIEVAIADFENYIDKQLSNNMSKKDKYFCRHFEKNLETATIANMSDDDRLYYMRARQR